MFNLQTAAGWDALGAAWRVALSHRDAAIDEFDAAEARAHADPGHKNPSDAPTHEASLAVHAANEAIEALHGVPIAEGLQDAASDTEGALVDEALGTRAPTLTAFMLKLDMVSDAWGFNDFDAETWPLFVADVRRFAMLKATKGKGVQ